MDIVETLRERYRLDPTVQQAADEIERLREALQKIADIDGWYIKPPSTPEEANLFGIIEGCVRVAEKTLGRKE